MRAAKCLIILLFALFACGEEEDNWVLRYAVQSSDPLTITCVGDELGQEITFNHPGGLWVFEFPCKPPAFYKITLTSAVAQNPMMWIGCQEDYDGVVILYWQSFTMAAGVPQSYGGFTPDREELEEWMRDPPSWLK